jgi:hypothetical protein
MRLREMSEVKRYDQTHSRAETGNTLSAACGGEGKGEVAVTLAITLAAIPR